jgi:hypothetical protein
MCPIVLSGGSVITTALGVRVSLTFAVPLQLSLPLASQASSCLSGTINIHLLRLGVVAIVEHISIGKGLCESIKIVWISYVVTP